MDVAIAAQSFHWFTNRSALEEIHRVLVPNGAFGLMWYLLDVSVPWEKDFFDFLRLLDEKHSLVFPHFGNWKEVFSRLSQHLFTTPEECNSFEHCLQASSFDQAYKHFAAYSIIAGGSESDKKAFHELFTQLMQKHFKEKGISFEGIRFKMYMYWCRKEI